MAQRSSPATRGRSGVGRGLLAILVAGLLICALTPATAHAQALPQARVALPAGAVSVEIPFEMYRHWLLVPVRVQGSEPLSFILDTGAPITVLASMELGLTLPFQIIGNVVIGGAGGGEAATVPVAGDVELSIGDLHISGAPVAIGLGTDKIAGADGIIGGPIFQQLVVEIDWYRQVLIVHDPATYVYSGDGSVLQLRTMASGHLMTTARVSVAGEEPVAVTLVVDSGAGHALSIEVETVDGLRRPARTLDDVLIGWGSNGAARGAIGRVSSLELGDHRLRGVVTTFPDNSPWSRIGDMQGVRLHGNLGSQVLQRFRVIFDVPHGRLILEPNASFGEPFGFDHAGLALTPWSPGAEAVTIADVVADSPAAEAGLEVGDEITAIGAQAVLGLSADDIQELLEGEPGDKLYLTVRRQGDTFERVLTLRPLI